MQHSKSLLQATRPFEYEPTSGASRTGYREISGEIPGTGEPVALRCWVIVFHHNVLAFSRYTEIVTILGEVDGTGRAIANLPGLSVDRFGSMSERTDLIGDLATIWVTARFGDEDARGAVLTATQGSMVHVIGVQPYLAEGIDRPVPLLEQLAVSMADRQAELKLPPEADTMSRLPLLGDFGDTLDKATIGMNVYRARP